MEKKKQNKPDPQSAIGNDPFAGMTPDAWEEIGVAPEAESGDAADASPPPESAAPVIEIQDEADMALAAWLYLDHTAPHETPEEAAPELPEEDALLSHLIDKDAKEDKGSNKT